MKKTYSEKLKDPRWQKKRLEVMSYANWRCQICGTKDDTLHCHHSYYTKGKQPWQYPKGAIICICKACHEKVHGEPKVIYRTYIEPPVQPEIPLVSAPQVVKCKFGALRAAVERVFEPNEQKEKQSLKAAVDEWEGPLQ